jgi:hypothetical protein
MARPKGPAIKIDPQDVLKYAKTGATQADIALRLGVSLPTLERRLQLPQYREALQAGRGELNISLRAKQIQVALAGNVQMLKWLGEQYLGQAHAHRLVDQEGKDRNLDIASVRAYMKAAPPDEE